MGVRMEQMLEDMIGFTLPDGDAGIVEDVSFKKIFPDQGNSFTPGQEMVFTISGAQHAFDPYQSYIQFELKVSGATKTTALGGLRILSGGTQGLVKTLRITTLSGVDLEYIEHYNRLAVAQDRWCLSNDYRRLEGHAELLPPHSSEASLYGCFGDLKQDDATSARTVDTTTVGNSTTNGPHPDLNGPIGELRRMYEPLEQTYANGKLGKPVKLHLRASDILGKKKLFPLDATGNIKVTITLEEFRTAFQSVLHNSVTVTAMDDSITGGGFAGPMDHVATSAQDTAITYTVTNPVFNLRMVKLAPGVRETISNATAGNGLPLTINTWHVIKQSIPASNTTTPATVTINKNVANLQSGLLWMSPSDNDATNPEELRDSFKMVHHGLDTFRLRWGAKNVPDYSDGAATSTEKYELVRYAWNFELDERYRNPGVPLIRYDPKCAYWKGSTVAYAGTTDINDRRQESTCDLYCVGASLQTIPGVALSGVTTQSGSQITFELGWDKNGESGAVLTNQYHARAVTLYAAVRYTRVIMFHGSQNVRIRE